jgi:hypothetical protein
VPKKTDTFMEIVEPQLPVELTNPSTSPQKSPYNSEDENDSPPKEDVMKRVRERRYFQCSKCNYTSERLQNIERHKRSKHKIILCKPCNKDFVDQGEKNHHELRVHLKNVCSICKKTFRENIFFKRHMIYNHKN